MSLNLDDCLVIGISSRSLFDLQAENEIFLKEGLEAYQAHQREKEDVILQPGPAFHLVKSLLQLNKHAESRLVEVVVMSRNTPDTGLRIFNSIDHHHLDISRAAFTGGERLSRYLDAFSVDLFLSRSEQDVQTAINKGCAAAVLYDAPADFEPETNEIRIAFDADAVLFSAQSERIFQQEGLEGFQAHELANSHNPMPEGPFAKLLKAIAFIQTRVSAESIPVRIAIVTARNSPSHARVIRTLRAWNLNVDEAYFLGGVNKDAVLKAFRAHIFFDDQESHVDSASKIVPSGKVPYREGDNPYLCHTDKASV